MNGNGIHCLIFETYCKGREDEQQANRTSRRSGKDETEIKGLVGKTSRYLVLFIFYFLSSLVSYSRSRINATPETARMDDFYFYPADTP